MHHNNCKQKNNKKMRKNVFIYLAILLVFSACKNEKAITIQPQTVRISEVLLSEDSNTREFPFISKAFQTSELSFRVGGPINNLDIQAGDYFKKGDVIASLDKRDYLINKEAKEAQYIQAEAEFHRVKSLYEKKNVSAKIFDNARTNYNITKSAYAAAVNALGDTQLIAPFNGYIQNVKTEAHQVIRANQTVLSFINIEQLKLEAYIPEDIALFSKQIKSIDISFDALKNIKITASSWDISKSTTSNNISFLLTAIVDNCNKGFDLLGGMTGKMSFTLTRENESSTLKIPQVAVCNRPSIGSYVWLYNSKTERVQMTPVSLGALKENAYVEITKGLATNDIVVTTGLNFLSNNKLVTILNK